MEKKMETTNYVLGSCRGFIGDNGKESKNYYNSSFDLSTLPYNIGESG